MNTHIHRRETSAMKDEFQKSGKLFLFPYIGGRAVTPETTEENLYDSVAERLRGGPSQAIANRILGRDLSAQEIQGILANTKDHVQKAFAGKIPEPPDHTAINITLQGAPGSGKTEDMFQEFSNLPIWTQNKFVYCAYDEHGAIEDNDFWLSLVSRLEGYEKLLDARNIVRDSTGVAYDLINNKALRDRYNIIHDTTVSSPHAVTAMKTFAEHNFINHGRAYYAPWPESLKRCLGRKRAINKDEEIIGKRGPVHANFPAYMNAMAHEGGGRLKLFFTPDIDGRFTKQTAFEMERGLIKSNNPEIIKAMIENLEQDLKDPDLRGAPQMEEGTAATIGTLEKIIDLQPGVRLENRL